MSDDNKVTYNVEVDDSDFKAKMSGIQKTLDNVERDISKLANKSSKSFSSIGASMTGSMIKAQLLGSIMSFVRQSAVSAAKEFITFKDKLQKANTILGIGRKELEAYGKQLQLVSISTGKSAVDIAEGWYQALSAGVAVEDSVKFINSAAMLATAGFTTTEKSVDLLTSALAAFRLEAHEATRVSDLFLAAQNVGKITIDSLASSFYNVGPVAAQAGIKIEEVSAAMAALTLQGVPAAQAAVMLKQTIVELTRDGTKGAKEFEKQSGETFNSFISNGGTFEQALKILKDRSESTGKGIATMFASIESGQGVAILAGDAAKRYAESLDKIKKQTGLVSKGVETMNDSVAGQLKILSANAQTTYNNILESTGKLAKAMQELNKQWEYFNIESSRSERTVKNISEKYTLLEKVVALFTVKVSETTKVRELYNKALEKGATKEQAIIFTDNVRSELISINNNLLSEGAKKAEIAAKTTEYLAGVTVALNEIYRDGAVDMQQFHAAMAAFQNKPVYGYFKGYTTPEKPKESEGIKLSPAIEQDEELTERQQKLVYQQQIDDQLIANRMEYYNRMLELKITNAETIQSLDENQHIAELQATVNFWKTKEGYEKQYQESLLRLKEATLRKQQGLNKKELTDEQKFNNDREKLYRISNKVASNLQDAFLDGRVKGLGDLINILAEEVSAEMAAKATTHLIQGVSDTALGASYLARPTKAALAPLAFKSAAENFSAAALFGGGALLIGGLAGMTSGSSGSDSTTTPDTAIGGSEDVEQEIIKLPEDEGRTVILDVDDAVYETLLNKLNQTADDIYNIRLVGTKY